MKRIGPPSERWIRLGFSFLALGVVLLLLAGCRKKTAGEDNLTIDPGPPPYEFPYKLKNPEKTYPLPKSLREISGICHLEENLIACIQDEKANIYLFDLEKGKKSGKGDFGKDGDFEELAFVEGVYWVARSDGKLYEVHNFDTGLQQVNKYPTFLTEQNNVEGLCYDRKRNRLLLACKDHPGENVKGADARAIYGFDLKEKVLQKEPVWEIDLAKMEVRTPELGLVKSSPGTPGLGRAERFEYDFRPSGVAIHPLTGDLYIISATAGILVVISPEAKILTVEKLKKKKFPHPEGLTFLPNGDLLISNEAEDHQAIIQKFVYKPPKE